MASEDIKKYLSMVIDEDGLKKLALEEVMDQMVKSKLEEMVAKSDNTLDDTLLAIIYPVIRAEVEKAIDKLLGNDQPA